MHSERYTAATSFVGTSIWGTAIGLNHRTLLCILISAILALNKWVIWHLQNCQNHLSLSFLFFSRNFLLKWFLNVTLLRTLLLASSLKVNNINNLYMHISEVMTISFSIHVHMCPCQDFFFLLLKIFHSTTSPLRENIFTLSASILFEFFSASYPCLWNPPLQPLQCVV